MVDLGAHIALDVGVQIFCVLEREVFRPDAFVLKEDLVSLQQFFKGNGVREAIQPLLR